MTPAWLFAVFAWEVFSNPWLKGHHLFLMVRCGFQRQKMNFIVVAIFTNLWVLSSTSIPLSKPLTLGKRERRIEGNGDIITIRGDEFLGSSFIFTVRIFNFLLSLCAQLQQSTASYKQQTITSSLRILAFIYPLKISQNFKHRILAESSCNWQNRASTRSWGKS